MKQSIVKRRDPLTDEERSARMALVKGKGNRSTELCVAGCLVRAGIRGWQRHSPDVTGHPDFVFPAKRIAIFVDGCFWHGCPSCRRNVPYSRRRFWVEKIAVNRRRDRHVTRTLKAQGYAVLRLWEHQLTERKWLTDLKRLLS
jgi:DNA mismatch endonuclease, patch repair protein